MSLLLGNPLLGNWTPGGLRAGLPTSKWQPIIHCPAEVLLATDVALRGLDRRMTEKKLDLFQFPSGRMAQASARPTEIMRSERLNVSAPGAGLYYVPNHVLCNAAPPNLPVLAD